MTVICSCSENALISDPFEYTEGSFAAKIEGCVEEFCFCAKVTSAYGGDGGGRKITVVFSAPQSLSGMTVTVDGEKMKARLDSIVADEWNAVALPVLIEALCQRRTPQTVRAVGGGMLEVKVCDKNCNIEYLFDEGNGIPVKISGKAEGDSFLFTITDFEVLK
ncbi:MAG: hypothetical protein E7649_02980 [Ruminococcaceae bacterium]|nr:hypothetical protein [Oscillospiraceae bacterium]